MAKVKAAYSHNNDRLLRNGDLNAFGRYLRTATATQRGESGLTVKKNHAKYFPIIDEVEVDREGLLAIRTFPFKARLNNNSMYFAI